MPGRAGIASASEKMLAKPLDRPRPPRNVCHLMQPAHMKFPRPPVRWFVHLSGKDGKILKLLGLSGLCHPRGWEGTWITDLGIGKVQTVRWLVILCLSCI